MNLDVHPIREGLLGWFEANRRDLPWRNTRDPYRILVSEVMLQQTQVDRVIPYYERFLERFPDLGALASAPASEVIRLWSGLGYNRRAINLQRTAQAVVHDHGGDFPRTVDALRALPGIGPYTAGAIACFAFEQDVAFLDTNMRRVIHRLAVGPELPELKLSEKELVALAAALVPPGDGWRWNQALIEFGALQCTARKPACVVCPLREQCVAAPVIHATIAALPKGTRLKNEGMFEGSNRQYRGRILRALQAAPEGLTLVELGPTVHEAFTVERLPWLAELVEALARDGLAEIAEAPATYDAGAPTSPIVRLPD